MTRRSVVVMPQQARPFVEDRLEESVLGRQLRLPSLPDCEPDLAPHCGHDDDVSEGALATKLSEHLEIPRRDTPHPHIGDSVHVDHASELFPVLVSGITICMLNYAKKLE
jgi:hypothetical protein